MENDRTFALVVGYHADSYPLVKAHDAGLTNRFAVVFDTFRRDKGYLFFDADLFVRILKGICRAIPHDSLTIDIGTAIKFTSIEGLSESYRALTDEDREPPTSVSLQHGARLAAHAETEWWVFAGGPAPYHDSYTLSFYTSKDRSEEFQGVCVRIGKEVGATITGVHKTSATKEPFPPRWKRLLIWIGVLIHYCFSSMVNLSAMGRSEYRNR